MCIRDSYNSLKNIEKEEKDKEIKAQTSQKIEKFKNKVYRTFKTELEENGCIDRKSTRLNSSHITRSRMPSSA